MAAAAAELAAVFSLQPQSYNAPASSRVGGHATLVVRRRPSLSVSAQLGQEGPRGVSQPLQRPLRALLRKMGLHQKGRQEGADSRGVPAAPQAGGGGGGNGAGGAGGGGGSGGGDGEGGAGDDAKKNTAEALAALAAMGKGLESLPADLAKAVTEGKVTGAIVERFFGLQGSPLFRVLLGIQGFKERLLADDLFMTKVAIECGVGLFTKTAAEYSKRKEKFFDELDFVIADVIMALLADFALTWLPAPTINLSSSVSAATGPVARFLAGCPDNAFQVAIRGTSYSFLQRIGAIMRNGGKLFVVGTGASLAGTAATNGLIQLRKSTGPKDPAAADSAHAEAEVPILQTSVAYGVYMAISSNLRYQVLAGVVEQRFLEPLLEKNKLALSVLSFIARTGNTFLGSLLWVDYARFVGVQ